VYFAKLNFAERAKKAKICTLMANFCYLKFVTFFLLFRAVYWIQEVWRCINLLLMRSKAIIVFLAMCYLYLILTTTKNGNPTILQLVLFKDTNTRKELVSAVDRVGQSITILFHKISVI